jgi:hypothetical protein
LERMTALRIMRDHDGLLHSADGGSGVGSVALENRWVLAATCVLVTLGLLLCAERPSLAKEPVRVPDPADPATPQRSVGQGPESTPVAPSRPATPRAEQPVRGEPANGSPASRPAVRPARPIQAAPEPAGAPKADPGPPISRPAPRPPAEHGAPIDRGKPAVPPGRQVSSPHRPAHVPQEHPQRPLQGPPQGPPKPVGQDHPVRPHPEKPVVRGPVLYPDKQPTPKPKPEQPFHEPQGNPQGGEDTGRPKGSHGQQGGSGGTPDAVNTPTPGNDGIGAPGQPEVRPGQDTATDQKPGNASHQIPAVVGKRSEGEGAGGGAGYKGTAANTPPAGGPTSGTDMGQQPDSRATSAVSPGHEPGSGTRSTETAADTAAPHPTAVRGEDPMRTDGHSLAVGTPPAAPAGGERPPAGYGVRAASEAPLGSTEYFFGYLWDESTFSVQQDQDSLGLMRDGARGFPPATSHGDALTQRAPPLPVPSPFSGFGFAMGGAVFSASSSGDGYAPLLAVIFCCLTAVLWRGRSRAYGALLRAGTVPRLALERPG